VRLGGEGEVRGQSKFDLCAGSGAAPDFEMRTDVLRPLSHSWESPVTLPPALLQYVPIDSGAVVTDT
jgi:hypothetical protein